MKFLRNTFFFTQTPSSSPNGAPAAPLAGGADGASAGWQLSSVGLRRGATQVFDALDLRLDEPRIGLIGRNGAGKTSLLRMLSGLETPHAGRIAWRGQTLHGDGRSHAPGRHVGLMFQNPDDQIIFPTVQEELALSWQSAHDGDRHGAREGVAQFLHQRGMADWGPRAVAALSQGQRQWVCWLALLLAGPSVLLLDEPYASLDLPGQLRMAHDIAASGQQIIVSTHVLDHVRGLDRVLWLDCGRVRADGPGAQICADYEAWVRSGHQPRTDAGQRPLEA